MAFKSVPMTRLNKFHARTVGVFKLYSVLLFPSSHHFFITLAWSCEFWEHLTSFWPNNSSVCQSSERETGERDIHKYRAWPKL